MLWNLKPNPATGYKTLCWLWNKEKSQKDIAAWFFYFIYSVNNLQDHMKILLMSSRRMATCTTAACQSCGVRLWRDDAPMNLPAQFIHSFASIQNASKWHQSSAWLRFVEQLASIFTLKIHSSLLEHRAAPQWVINQRWCVSQGSQLTLPSFLQKHHSLPPHPQNSTSSCPSSCFNRF